MNNINVFLYSYDDFENHGPIVSSDIGVNNINKDALDECTYDIWRKVYRDKIDFNPNVVYLKNIEEDTKKLHNENQKYNLYCKIVQVDGFLGSTKIADIKVNFDNKEDKILHRNTGFHNCVYPYDIEKSFFGLFKSSWPTWILEDLESGNCKIILHNILEEFTSRGYDAYFKTIQHQLKEFNLKEKYITIIDFMSNGKEYFKLLDTEMKFVYSNMELGYFIESESSEIKRENLPSKPDIKKHRDRYFISLNRNAKLFRAIIIFNLWKNNSLDKGYVSLWIKEWWIPRFNNDADLLRKDILTILGQSGVGDVDGNKFIDFIFENDLSVDGCKQFERDGNVYPVLGHIYSRFDSSIHNAYKNSYFSITSCNSFGWNKPVAGSNFYIDEKLFPAILHFLPFILVGRYLLLRDLKDKGFKTFHPHIDESYDEVEDPVMRMKMVMGEVNRLCSLSSQEIHNWYSNLSHILQYNYDFYFNEFLPLQVNNFYDELLLKE